MKRNSGIIFSLIFLFHFSAFTQNKDTLVKKLDSLSLKSDSLNNGKSNVIKQENYNETTRLDFRTYFILLGNDFKQQVTLPFHTKKKDWTKVAAFAGLVGVSTLADEGVARFAVDLRANSTTVTVSKYVTNTGGIYEAVTLTALAGYGFIFKNEKIKTTALLASQAYLTSSAISIALKFVTGRQRPIYYDPKTGENEAVFHGPFFQFKKDEFGKKPENVTHNSFPSGHTTVAFAAATVFAMEYRDRPLVPIISYSAASLVGLSRITENRHWTSDVLVGAAIGFLSGKQVVNNYHRYARVKNQLKKKNTISFQLQYFDGRLLPGMIYKFHHT